jgi:hypothetical protein
MSLQNVIAECHTFEHEEEIPWIKIAEKHGVIRSTLTLTRTYRGETQPHATKIINQQHLTPQEEAELVAYIDLTLLQTSSTTGVAIGSS